MKGQTRHRTYTMTNNRWHFATYIDDLVKSTTQQKKSVRVKDKMEFAVNLK